MNAMVSVRRQGGFDMEAAEVEARNLESLLIELGAIKGACQGVERDFGRLSDDVNRNAEAWRHVAVEQGALRASIDRINETLKDESKKTNDRIDAIEKSVRPLVEWQKTGTRLVVILGSVGIALWSIFGSGVQKLGADVMNWLTHRAP